MPVDTLFIKNDPAMNTPIHLPVAKLTADAFQPFGTAFSLSSPGSSGPLVTHQRLHPLLDMPRLTTTQLAMTADAAQITRLERHPFSSQTFIPLLCTAYLVVVAPQVADGGPDLSGLRAFAGDVDTGVHYAAGVWHAPMRARGGPARFVIQMWRHDELENDVFIDLPTPIACVRRDAMAEAG